MFRSFRTALRLLILIAVISGHSLLLQNIFPEGGEKGKYMEVRERVSSFNSLVVISNSIRSCIFKTGEGELPAMLDVYTIVENNAAFPAYNKIKFLGNAYDVFRTTGNHTIAVVGSNSVLRFSFCVLQGIINAYRIMLI